MSLIENSRNINVFPPHINPLAMESYSTLEPKFLSDALGRPMLYPGEIHVFYGRPQTFKSWALMPLIGSCEVRYVDFENGLMTIRNRLKALNVAKEDAEVFCFPESPAELTSRIIEYIETKPDVVCFDGLPGLLRLLGKDGDSNNDVNEVFATYIEPLKKAGVAVVLLEHLPKSSSEANDDYPIGAQSKKSVPGVLFLHRPRKTEDTVDIFIAKDRHNSIAERCDDFGWPKPYGFIQLNRDGALLDPRVEPFLVPFLDGEQIESHEAKRMLDVWNACAQSNGLNQSEIEEAVGGNHRLRRNATDSLLKKGYLRGVKQGRSLKYIAIDNLKIEWRNKV